MRPKQQSRGQRESRALKMAAQLGPHSNKAAARKVVKLMVPKLGTGTWRKAGVAWVVVSSARASRARSNYNGSRRGRRSKRRPEPEVYYCPPQFNRPNRSGLTLP